MVCGPPGTLEELERRMALPDHPYCYFTITGSVMAKHHWLPKEFWAGLFGVSPEAFLTTNEHILTRLDDANLYVATVKKDQQK